MKPPAEKFGHNGAVKVLSSRNPAIKCFLPDDLAESDELVYAMAVGSCSVGESYDPFGLADLPDDELELLTGIPQGWIYLVIWFDSSTDCRVTAKPQTWVDELWPLTALHPPDDLSSLPDRARFTEGPVEVDPSDEN